MKKGRSFPPTCPQTFSSTQSFMPLKSESSKRGVCAWPGRKKNGGRCKHRQRKNQQNVKSIFEIDKLSGGGWGGSAFRETVDFLLAGKEWCRWKGEEGLALIYFPCDLCLPRLSPWHCHGDHSSFSRENSPPDKVRRQPLQLSMHKLYSWTIPGKFSSVLTI